MGDWWCACLGGVMEILAEWQEYIWGGLAVLTGGALLRVRISRQSSTTTVDQSGSVVGGDQVAGNKDTTRE